MATIGTLNLKLAVQGANFGKALEQAGEHVEKLSKQVKGMANDLASVGVAVSAFAAASLAAAAEVDDRAAASLEAMKESTQALGVEVATILAPAFKAVADSVQGVADWLANLSPGMREFVGHMAAAAATSGVLLMGLSGVANVAGGVADAMQLGGKAMQGLPALWAKLGVGAAKTGTELSGAGSAAAGLLPRMGALLAGIGAALAPVLAVAAAVAAIIVIVAFLWRAWKENWGGIQEKTRAVLEWITTKAQAAMAYIGEAFSWLYRVSLKVLGKLAEPLIQQFELMMKAASWALKKLGKDTSGLDEFVKQVAGWGRHVLTEEGNRELLGDAAKLGLSVGGAIADGVQTGISGTVQTVGMLLDDVKKALGFGGPKKGGAGARHMEVEVGQASSAGMDTPAWFAKLAEWGSGVNEVVEAFNAASVKSAIGVTTDYLGGIAKKGLEYVKATAELQRRTAEEAARVLEQARRAMAQRALSMAGDAGSIIQAGMTGAAAGGPWGAIIAVLMEFLARSKGFAEFLKSSTAMIATLADALGKFAPALKPIHTIIVSILQPLFEALAPVLQAMGEALEPFIPIAVLIGQILGALAPILNVATQLLKQVVEGFGLLRPVLTAVFDVIRFVAKVILGVITGIALLWNGIIGLLSGVFKTLGKIPIVGGAFKKVAEGLDKLKVDTDALQKSQRDLDRLNEDAARAKGQEIADTLANAAAQGDAAAAAQDVAEQLSNVAQGFRYNAAVYSATDLADLIPKPPGAAPGAGGGVTTPDTSTMPAPMTPAERTRERIDRKTNPRGEDPRDPYGGQFAAGGVLTRRVDGATVGEAGPEAIIPLSKLPELMGQMGGGSGGSTIIANFYGVTDPRELWAKLRELAARDNFAVTGNSRRGR